MNSDSADKWVPGPRTGFYSLLSSVRKRTHSSFGWKSFWQLFYICTEMFIADWTRACWCVFLKVALEETLKHSCFFSIIKDKSETGKKKKSYLLPFCASHVGTHPFGLRHFLNQGSVAAWSQGLIFLGAYLPSYSSASAGWYTLLFVLHISASFITRLIAGTNCSLSCTSVNPELCNGAFKDCFSVLALDDDERCDAFKSHVKTRWWNPDVFQCSWQQMLWNDCKVSPHFSVFFFSVRISKAADFKDHKIQVASCLISLKVEPSPALSSSLLGGPLIKIVLTHLLVSLSNRMPQFPCVCDSRCLSVCLLGK